MYTVGFHFEYTSCSKLHCKHSWAQGNSVTLESSSTTLAFEGFQQQYHVCSLIRQRQLYILFRSWRVVLILNIIKELNTNLHHRLSSLFYHSCLMKYARSMWLFWHVKSTYTLSFPLDDSNAGREGARPPGESEYSSTDLTGKLGKVLRSSDPLWSPSFLKCIIAAQKVTENIHCSCQDVS